MNCRECRERLLEAGLTEIAVVPGGSSDRLENALEGRSGEAWRRHIQECSPCAALAGRILRAQEELVAGLAVLTPTRPLEEAVAAASRESARRRSRIRWVSWGAAAAVAAGVLGIRALDSGSGVGTDAIRVAVMGYPGSAVGPEVEATLGESVVVLETDNENMVVFWFYQGRGE